MNPTKVKSTSPQNSTRPKTKKRKPKISPKAQSERFLQAAREAGCSEDEAAFDETLKRIAKVSNPKKRRAEEMIPRSGRWGRWIGALLALLLIPFVAYDAAKLRWWDFGWWVIPFIVVWTANCLRHDLCRRSRRD